jgi:hypothetical protein
MFINCRRNVHCSDECVPSYVMHLYSSFFRKSRAADQQIYAVLDFEGSKSVSKVHAKWRGTTGRTFFIEKCLNHLLDEVPIVRIKIEVSSPSNCVNSPEDMIMHFRTTHE